MRYRDSRNIRTLARYLDRDWLAPSALRAFKALVAAGAQHDRIHIQEAVGPWDGEPDVILDPDGLIIR